MAKIVGDWQKAFIGTCSMPRLFDNLIDFLRGHSPVESVRVVEYDEANEVGKPSLSGEPIKDVRTVMIESEKQVIKIA